MVAYYAALSPIYYYMYTFRKEVEYCGLLSKLTFTRKPQTTTCDVRNFNKLKIIKSIDFLRV